MDQEEVLRAVYLRGLEVGASFGDSEMEGCSTERARFVLDLIESDDFEALWDEIPAIRPWIPDEWPGLNDTHEAGRLGMMVLAEAGLEAYDGIADEATLMQNFNKGYCEGAEETIAQAARRRLGLEQ